MRVEYNTDKSKAYFNGFAFRRDLKTGYYLSSKKTDIGKRERLHCYVWRFFNGAIPENAEIQFVGIKGIKQLENQPVYNMEVEDNHNFAVNGGIIVHNCMDAVRYFVQTERVYKKVEPYQGMF